MKLPILKTFAWVLAASFVCHAGCRSFETPSLKLPFMDAEKDEMSPDMTGVKPPQKVVALWTDTTFNTPGKPPTRGLGARLYFYDEDRKPVPVEGRLIVYGYDDSQPTASKREPDRKYIFKPEKLASHYSESDFGPSYSIWLPWDTVGDPQKEISALPVLTTKSGVVVMGDLTRHVLPGPKRDDVAPAGEQPYEREYISSTDGVRLTAFEGNTGRPAYAARNAGGNVRSTDEVEMATISTPTINPNDQLRATSIRLSPTVKQRLIHSTPKDIPRHQFPARTHAPESQIFPRYSGLHSQYRATATTSGSTTQQNSSRDSVPSPGLTTQTPPGLAQPVESTAAWQRPSTHYGLPRRQVPNSPASQPVYAPPQTQQYPVTAPSVPAWPPGYPLGNSATTGGSTVR